MSARLRSGATGARTVSGLLTSSDRSGPSKWTSPPNANVTGPFGAVVVVTVELGVGTDAKDGLIVVELRVTDGREDSQATTTRRTTTAAHVVLVGRTERLTRPTPYVSTAESVAARLFRADAGLAMTAVGCVRC
jgi:hypothetical protein